MYILHNMTTINIRVEEMIKSEAGKTLANLGMDMSTAIKIFLNQVIIEGGLPFTPSTKRKDIRAIWDKEVEVAKKTKGFKSVNSAINHALK